MFKTNCVTVSCIILLVSFSAIQFRIFVFLLDFIEHCFSCPSLSVTFIQIFTGVLLRCVLRPVKFAGRLREFERKHLVVCR